MSNCLDLDFSDFSDNHPLIKSYRSLKQTPISYYENLMDILKRDREYQNYQDLIENLSESVNCFSSITSAKFLLSIDIHSTLFYQIILKRDEEKLEQRITDVEKNIHNRIVEYIQSELPNLQHDINQLSEFLEFQVHQFLNFLILELSISLIQDNSILLQYLLLLYSPNLIVKYNARLISPKLTSQVHTYIVNLVYSKLPENFSSIEIHAIYAYFSMKAVKLEVRETLDLIPIIERMHGSNPIHFSPIPKLIEDLYIQKSDIINEMAWNYPRAAVRHEFLAFYIRITDHSQLRKYYKEHPSEMSRRKLLKLVFGNTSDPFFLRKHIDRYQKFKNLRKLWVGVLSQPLENINELSELLIELPDNYDHDSLIVLFGSNYRSPFRILNQIIDRISKEDRPLAEKIRSKYRFLGIVL